MPCGGGEHIPPIEGKPLREAAEPQGPETEPGQPGQAVWIDPLGQWGKRVGLEMPEEGQRAWHWTLPVLGRKR